MYILSIICDWVRFCNKFNSTNYTFAVDANKCMITYKLVRVRYSLVRWPVDTLSIGKHLEH